MRENLFPETAAVRTALCRFVWNLTSSTAMYEDVGLWHGLQQGIGRQVFELGHTQVGDGDEVCGGSEASGSTLGLLQQPVHRLHVGMLRLSSMPRTTPSRRCLSVLASFLNGSSRLRLAQLIQPTKSVFACAPLFSCTALA